MFSKHIEPDAQSYELTAHDFAENVLEATAFDDDKNCIFRRDHFSQLGRLGLVSLSIPKIYGGQGAGYETHLKCLQEIAETSPAMAIVIGVTNLTMGGIIHFGSEEQKLKYLPKLASGEWLGAFSLSEPGSGSDAASLKLSAKCVDQGFLLNGNKLWCTNSGHADLYLVMARTSAHRTKGITSFLIEKNTPGFHIGKQESKLGLRASTLSELVFTDCFVGESQRLGSDGQGFQVALSQLDFGRVTIGLVGYAVSRRSLEITWKTKEALHTSGKDTFGDGERSMIAEFYSQSEAIRTLLREVAELKHQSKSITEMASIIKLLGSDLAMKVTSDCLSILGMHGFFTNSIPLERMYRDAKALQIVEGTNQVQKVILSRILQGKWKV